MATGIKQKLLTYHIAKRDEAQRKIDTYKGGAFSAEGIRSYHTERTFHAEAVEFLSNGG